MPDAAIRTSLRIAMLLSSADASVGGTQKQAHALAKELESRGACVAVVTKPQNAAGDGRACLMTGDASTELNGHVRVIHLPVVNRQPGWSFLVSFLVWAVVNRRRFDVIHAHSTSIGLIASLVGRVVGKPVVVKIPGLRSVEYMRGQTLGCRLRRWALNTLAHRFVVVSSELAQVLVAAGIAPVKVARIPNGVAVTPCAPGRRQGALKLEWLGSADVDTVLYVGRLAQEKGVDRILELWTALARVGAVLVIVGDGPQRDSLERQAATLGLLGSVRFLGRQTDVRPFYEMADLFVLPSRTEGVSNALLEAMAAGLPVVASDVGGNRDIVEHGRSGLLLDLDDTAAWMRGIADLLDDPRLRDRLGTAARRRAASFSIGEVAERYLDLYETLLPADRR
jgi:glycosyltransferase involved in cell wall biosynthesis